MHEQQRGCHCSAALHFMPEFCILSECTYDFDFQLFIILLAVSELSKVGCQFEWVNVDGMSNVTKQIGQDMKTTRFKLDPLSVCELMSRAYVRVHHGYVSVSSVVAF